MKFIPSPWRFLVFVLTVTNVVLAIALLTSERGIYSYIRMSGEHGAMLKRFSDVKAENADLSREIRLIKEDRDYQEKLIRTELHFLKRNEILYIAPRKPKQGDGPHAGEY